MYTSFAEIQAEKDKLSKDIEKKKREIGRTWDELFHKETDNLIETPTQRILRLANSGAGVLDGAILGWKLYRRLKTGSLFSFGRKKR